MIGARTSAPDRREHVGFEEALDHEHEADRRDQQQQRGDRLKLSWRSAILLAFLLPQAVPRKGKVLQQTLLPEIPRRLAEPTLAGLVE